MPLKAWTVNPMPAWIVAYAAEDGNPDAAPEKDPFNPPLRVPELDKYITPETRVGEILGVIESGKPTYGCYLKEYPQ